MHIIRISIFLLFLCPLLSKAQSNFFSGYVVTNSGDTLKGYLEGKERDFTPLHVRFKSKVDGEISQMQVAECSAFGLYGKDEQYERHRVKISMGQIDLNKMSVGIDTSSREGIVFLKVLQKGKQVSLYAYADDIKKRFYIREGDVKEPVELILYQYYAVENTSEIKISSRYQNQLHLLLEKYETPGRQSLMLSRLRYDERDILKVVSMVNDYKRETPVQKSTDFYAGLGLNIHSARYSGYNQLVGSTAKNNVTPYLAIGANFYVNPTFKRTFFRLELSFGQVKNEFEKEDNSNYAIGHKHEYKQYNFAFAAHLMRNFYKTSNISIYGGAGLAAQYAITKGNLKTSTYLYPYGETIRTSAGPDLKDLSFLASASAGVVFYQKIELTLNYTPPMMVTDNYLSYDIKMSRFRAGLNYFFVKR